MGAEIPDHSGSGGDRGPLAGGHLGFSREQAAELEADTTDTAHTFHKEAYEAEIRSIIDFVKKLGEKCGKNDPGCRCWWHLYS